ncbi:chalcone isomerase family protein [Polaromonas sp. DSR2-3-2]|uniref:chalcone isomerase family protein n=1 Tax=unclassified Polaromonas TaxID=2638319 RepID=UPI003CE7B514
MTLTNRCLAGLAALMMSASLLAAPVEVSSIKLADPVELAGSRLQLNGAGIRYKAVFKVYVAALYLEKKAATPEEAFAVPGAKRISITLLREIDSNELGKSFTKAFEENAPKTEMSRLIPGLLKISQVFSDQKKMLPGESLTIDWIPGTGTVFSVKGKPQGEPIKEVEFYNAMLRIWLGPKPADWKLKDELLGKAA